MRARGRATRASFDVRVRVGVGAISRGGAKSSLSVAATVSLRHPLVSALALVCGRVIREYGGRGRLIDGSMVTQADVGLRVL